MTSTTITASPLFTLSAELMNNSADMLDSASDDGELAGFVDTTDNTNAKSDSNNNQKSKRSKNKRKHVPKSSSSSSAKALKTSTNSPTLSSNKTAVAQDVRTLQMALSDAVRSLAVKETRVSVVTVLSLLYTTVYCIVTTTALY